MKKKTTKNVRQITLMIFIVNLISISECTQVFSTKCESTVPYTSGDRKFFGQFGYICTCMASVLVSMGGIQKKKFFDGAL